MIHYHGLPLTGQGAPILAMQGRHCMASYAHPEQVAEAAELCQSFTLDNGAFSAWRSGTPFDLEGCAEWVSTWAMHPGCDWYCLPDVIDGGEDENAQVRSGWFSQVSNEVWRRGVPIWHLDEPLDVLQDFLAWHSPLIAIGSSGQYANIGTQKWWGRMAEAMEVVCLDGVPQKKLHGLRMLDPTIFSHFPFSSADSTNVARNVGIDKAWRGPYAPRSRKMRALIMLDRIEAHASAATWSNTLGGKNEELFG